MTFLIGGICFLCGFALAALAYKTARRTTRREYMKEYWDRKGHLHGGPPPKYGAAPVFTAIVDAVIEEIEKRKDIMWEGYNDLRE